jgi:hypothetical protein
MMADQTAAYTQFLLGTVFPSVPIGATVRATHEEHVIYGWRSFFIGQSTTSATLAQLERNIAAVAC